MKASFFLIIILLEIYLSGCIYVPTFEHGLVSGRAMIEQKQIDKLQPGKSTREEVLLTFGDPNERFYDDRVFCYMWERVRGIVGIAYVGGGDVGKVHYFCAEFSSSNIYLRGKHISANLLEFKSAESKRANLFTEWGYPVDGQDE